MNFLLKKMKEIEPLFMKGGRFEKLHSVYDGFATFLLFLTKSLHTDRT